jgi:hypothetical protein
LIESFSDSNGLLTFWGSERTFDAEGIRDGGRFLASIVQFATSVTICVRPIDMQIIVGVDKKLSNLESMLQLDETFLLQGMDGCGITGESIGWQVWSDSVLRYFSSSDIGLTRCAAVESPVSYKLWR